MDKELKAKWVGKLRDGSYRQCHGDWNNESGGYCCLGVLLHMTQGTTNGLRETASDLGVSDDDATPDRCSTMQTLINMNDGLLGQRKHTFMEIAAYIEKNL